MDRTEDRKTEYRGRQANFELLRVLSMYMVILLHYISRTGSLAGTQLEMTGVRLAGGFLESFCIVAVNVYVLISGYFLCKSNFKVSRLLQLLAQILFYSLLIPVILGIAGIRPDTPGGASGAWELSGYLFPISTEHYWFATAYVYMYLFTPLLGAALRHFTEKQLRYVLLSVLFFFCFLKSVFPVQFVMDKAGYDVFWFLCLYLTGAYIRLFGREEEGLLSGKLFRRGESGRRNGKGRALAIYAVSCILIFALHVLLHMIHEKTGRFAYYAGVPFHYNFLLCYTGAAGLFLAFEDLRIPEGKIAGIIRGIAPCTFGVYLLHEHLNVRSSWPSWMAALTGGAVSENPIGFLMEALVRGLLLYVICLCIDWLRAKLFSVVRKRLGKTRAAAWIKAADRTFQ